LTGRPSKKTQLQYPAQRNNGVKKNPPKKGSFLMKRNTNTTQSIQETTTSTNTSKFDNGLFTDENKYLQVSSSLLPSDHVKAAGLLTINYILHNYICDCLIKPIHLNLTMFAEEIMEGTVPFKFSINDKACFVPYFDNGYWNLLFFNAKKIKFLPHINWIRTRSRIEITGFQNIYLLIQRLIA